MRPLADVVRRICVCFCKHPGDVMLISTECAFFGLMKIRFRRNNELVIASLVIGRRYLL